MSDHLSGLTYDPPLDQGGAVSAPSLALFAAPMPTKDGHVCALIYTDGHWARFFEATGLTDLPQREIRVFAISPPATPISMNVLRRAEPHLRWTHQRRMAGSAARGGYPPPMPPARSCVTDGRPLHLAALDFFRTVQHPTEGAMHDMRPAAGFFPNPSDLTRLATSPGRAMAAKSSQAQASMKGRSQSWPNPAPSSCPKQTPDETKTTTTGEP